MKPLKHKLTSTEFSKQTDKRSNYKKFIKTTLIQRRKQLNINGDKSKIL
jgi:hypothetical protein